LDDAFAIHLPRDKGDRGAGQTTWESTDVTHKIAQGGDAPAILVSACRLVGIPLGRGSWMILP
jgi:hypothetical protein